jgi:hypothetical protein
MTQLELADAREIEAQHQVLFATLHAIEEILPYALTCQRRPRPLAAIRLLLRRLADQLHDHFEAEERDDAFGRIAAAEPRLAPRIDRLLRDHRELRLLVAAVLVQARSSDEEEVWRSVSRGFWLIRERLAWHEREENELVFQLHHLDLGQSIGG